MEAELSRQGDEGQTWKQAAAWGGMWGRWARPGRVLCAPGKQALEASGSFKDGFQRVGQDQNGLGGPGKGIRQTPRW